MKKMAPFLSGIVFAFLFMIGAYVLDDGLGGIGAYSSMYKHSLDIYRGFSFSLTWEEFFVIGVLAGAFVASMVSKQFKLQVFPEEHLSRGPAYYIGAGLFMNFFGGFLVMIGLIIAGESFLKMWNDALGLFMTVGLFVIIMFVESVIVGTMLSLRIEEK